MAAVLLAVGLFVYAQVGSDLDAALDNSLRSRADDIATVADGAGLGAADEDRLVAADESLAQVIGPGGTVLYSSRGIGERALLGADELARARRGPIFIDRESVAGFDERVRLLARPTDNRVVVVGATREEGDEALSSLGTVLLTGGPIALLLAAGAGYWLASAALRPVGAMRREAAEISRLGSGRRLPVPPAGDELSKLGGTLNEMLERLESLGRARAQLRGQREPRAAHPARPAEDGAGARAAGGPQRRGAARGRGVRGSRERPPRPAGRGPPGAGARRRGEAAGAPRAAGRGRVAAFDGSPLRGARLRDRSRAERGAHERRGAARRPPARGAGAGEPRGQRAALRRRRGRAGRGALRGRRPTARSRSRARLRPGPGRWRLRALHSRGPRTLEGRNWPRPGDRRRNSALARRARRSRWARRRRRRRVDRAAALSY